MAWRMVGRWKRIEKKSGLKLMKENRESLRLKTDIPLGTELEPSWTPQNRFTRVFTLPYLSNPSSSSSDRPPSVFLFLSLRRQPKIPPIQSLHVSRWKNRARARSNNTPFLSIVVNVPPFDTQSRDTFATRLAKLDSKVRSDFSKEGEDHGICDRRGEEKREGREGWKVEKWRIRDEGGGESLG